MTNSPEHPGRVVVVIPVKDEAAWLEPCLTALIHQRDAAFDEILVFINNSTDRSAAIASGVAASSAVPILIRDVVLPSDQAHAGGARRLAMQWAAARAGEHGILLTTDADGMVCSDWLAVNLAALSGGVDAVAGRARIDPRDEASLPPALIEADAQECHYAALLDEIDAHIDPDPFDPLPRHDEHSGASIAVTVAAWARAGGIPDVHSSEDRAFFTALRRIDARVRHLNEAVVTVSGRTEGRAAGGMADTIRRRMVATDAFLDSRLEPALAAIARVGFRRRFRLLWSQGTFAAPREIQRLASGLELPAANVHGAILAEYFGAAWMTLESGSPRLHRRPVPAAGVTGQIAIARRFLATLDADVTQQERLA
jgi:glycosyltransferase involved in cell wall biosynthesis